MYMRLTDSLFINALRIEWLLNKLAGISYIIIVVFSEAPFLQFSQLGTALCTFLSGFSTVNNRTTTAFSTSANKDYKASFRRQMDMYQWVARKRDLQVNNTGYFVYVECNITVNQV